MREEKIIGGRSFYGYEMGIIMLNSRFPRGIGDVGNAQSYDFPVLFRTVKGANVVNVRAGLDMSLLEQLVKAAKYLEGMGVKAVSTSCGFLVLYQQKIAAKLNVPFFSSTLLLLPLIEHFISKKILVITADSDNLTEDHFISAGVKDLSRLIVEGMENQPEFSRAILRDNLDLKTDKIAKEVRQTVSSALKKYSDIGSILFECHNLPPYSRDISREFGMPVFDYFSLVNLIHDSLSKKKLV